MNNYVHKKIEIKCMQKSVIYMYLKKQFLLLFSLVLVVVFCFVFFGGGGMLSGTIPVWLKLWPGSSLKFGAKSSTVL